MTISPAARPSLQAMTDVSPSAVAFGEYKPGAAPEYG